MFSGVVGHPVGLIHAAHRTVLVTGLWWLIPTHFSVFDDVRRQLVMPELPFAGHLDAPLYGGIVEELLLRAGVMTVIAGALARATRRSLGQAPTWLVWTSILAAALAFGPLITTQDLIA